MEMVRYDRGSAVKSLQMFPPGGQASDGQPPTVLLVAIGRFQRALETQLKK